MDYPNYNLGLDNEEIWDCQEKIGRFDAFFPMQDQSKDNIETVPPFIKIDVAGNSHYLKTKVKTSRRDYVWVNPKTYSGAALPTISYVQTSELSHLIYKIRNDKNQQAALFGLVIAVAGIIIDGTFAIGKAGYVRFVFSEGQVAVFMFLSMFLKIAGLCIVYKKGLKGGE